MVAWGLHTKLPKHSGLPSVQRLKAKPEKPFHELQENRSSMSQSQGTAGLALLAELQTAVSSLIQVYHGSNDASDVGYLEEMVSTLTTVINELNRNLNLTHEIARTLPYDDDTNIWLPRVIQTTEAFKQWTQNAQIPVHNTQQGDDIDTFELWIEQNAYVQGSALQQGDLEQRFDADADGAQKYLYKLFEYLKVVEQHLETMWHGVYAGLLNEFLIGPANA